MCSFSSSAQFALQLLHHGTASHDGKRKACADAADSQTIASSMGGQTCGLGPWEGVLGHPPKGAPHLLVCACVWWETTLEPKRVPPFL